MFGIKNIFKKTYSLALALSIVCCISPLAFLTSSVNDNEVQQVTQEDLHQLSNELAVLINQTRAEYGLSPLYVVPHLSDYSQVRAREAVHKFSHYRPTPNELSGNAEEGSEEQGDDFFQYLLDEDYPYITTKENLGASSTKPLAEEMLDQWMHSTEGHREAVLDPDMTHMGVAVTYEPKDQNAENPRKYEWYWELLLIQVQKDPAYAMLVDDPDNPGYKMRVYTSDLVLDGQFLPTLYDIVPESTGDLSGDAVVDSFDYLTILKYIEYQDALDKMRAGKEYDEEILNHPVSFNALQIEAADCFKDGYININDARVLRKYVLGEVTSLPYEFS